MKNNNSKQKFVKICPACQFLGLQTILFGKTQLNCSLCEKKLSFCQAPEFKLFKTFSKHNKDGLKCQDCKRFIPLQGENNIISCPYLDCYFVGLISSLKKMRHPTILSNEVVETSTENNFQSQDEISFLKNVINSQMISLSYCSSEFTIVRKTCGYQAILNLLNKFPTEMVNYLLHDSRRGGFQQRIFQEYIKLLEQSLPFSYKKNNKFHQVTSLLDEELSLFDGISTFTATLSDNLEIKNKTQEFYIGGRGATYAQPFYLGKILSINDKITKESLMNHIDWYGFSKIKMKEISPRREIIVTHLRVVPHYQMGAMSYINRIRKKIIEEVKMNWDNIQHIDDSQQYKADLKEAGWCLSCQGYGQELENGEPCMECKGSGKILNNENQINNER